MIDTRGKVVPPSMFSCVDYLKWTTIQQLESHLGENLSSVQEYPGLHQSALLEYGKRYRELNKEKKAEYNKKYRELNKE